jgi:hypothetical protein
MRRLLPAMLLLVLVMAAGCTSGSDGSEPAAATDAASTTIEDATTVTTSTAADAATGDATTSTSGITTAPPDPPGSTSTSSSMGVTTSTVAAATTTSIGTTPPSTGTRDAPVPLGQLAVVSPDWQLAVTAVELDATATVLSHAPFNPDPEPGYQYLIATLRGVYRGSVPGVPAIEWNVVSGDATYEARGVGCGVVPDSIYDVTELRAGEEFTANVCVPVASDAVDGATLVVIPFQYSGTYFALR